MNARRATVLGGLVVAMLLGSSATGGAHTAAGRLGPVAVSDVGDRPDRVASRPPQDVRFPTARNTGVPRGWSPRRVVDGDVVVRRRGAVVEDLRINGNLVVAAPDVTVRRVEVVGGAINNYAGSTCQTGLQVRRSTIRATPGGRTSGDEPAIGAGGYHAHRVRIAGLPEGFRVAGKDECGEVVITRSYATVVAPDDCGDWHGDALQGYDGGRLTLRSSRLELVEREGCSGTAPFFYPSGQGNTSVDIDGLLVEGGGYSFRLGTPGSVRGLSVVKSGFYYGPIDVKCSALDEWEASIVRVGDDGRPSPVRRQRCNTERGS